MANPPFGRLITAMVTPFTDDGSLDLDEARRLAAHLVDEMGNDALVINGTTGESPTTNDDEKLELLKAVVSEVGDRAKVIAGVGTNETAATIKRCRDAAEAECDGLLVVTPYYSKPPADALLEHFVLVADASELPVMLYDIPSRSGIPIPEETIIELARHPRIVAVKDAKGDLVSSAKVMSVTDLAYYSGDDAMTLPLMSVGGVGVVGTSTHFSGALTKEWMDLLADGDHESALEVYRRLLPVYTGVFATQGCMLVKAGLAARGFNAAVLRRPLKPASPSQARTFVQLLEAAGL
ncbi:4-hydroxy-tetrahydrodipicolinate synthase [Propioniciclava sp. MC1595]|uniref:4-hydroxy-tetrahydrodipicolinate synthase n=1 Tax=Propioniciclava sp. MC1595 TaxID=2760308 RepID=UPI00166286F7|nr:4-hydroxy-tetrahydrodipicolinate synthase [Propioniciclava sp. MC1595]MBB1493559.1 4-hydroxy-tetrahydrodipicolinate synthase [Propioniciclava sp. MC1595]QTE26951.1 4-hydroxy-tetrahydrodipicolinate synthase [Propioniciclava sp. MC1595]